MFTFLRKKQVEIIDGGGFTEHVHEIDDQVIRGISVYIASKLLENDISMPANKLRECLGTAAEIEDYIRNGINGKKEID